MTSISLTSIKNRINLMIEKRNTKRFFCAIVNPDGTIGKGNDKKYKDIEAYIRENGIKETDTLLQIKLDVT